ncbi:MAG: hypothetical protein KGJ05_06940, partial [Alphaproteobacteria bacterium]|nr:hypothetical protein [Alphaproteobacteria bacterium]
MNTEKAQPFKAGLLLGLVGVALAALIAFVFLNSYVPPMPEAGNGGNHALSPSANGFAGLVALETALGRAPAIARTDADLDTDGLLVLTPEELQSGDLETLLNNRAGRPTLIVLPKEVVALNPLHKGWTVRLDNMSTANIAKILAKRGTFKIVRLRTTATAKFRGDAKPVMVFNNMPDVQTIAGRNSDGDPLVPIFTDDINIHDLKQDHAIIAGIGNNVFVLADPDLLNNAGIADPQRAYAAVRFLDELSPPDHPQITFDVTLNGFGRARSLIDVLVRPPFLALTLCLIVAGIMALLSGLMRFGPPLAEARSIPPGKRGLVDNIAAMLRRAGAEHALGGRS